MNDFKFHRNTNRSKKKYLKLEKLEENRKIMERLDNNKNEMETLW